MLFHYAPGRGKAHPLNFLAGYQGRFLQCDAYQSYNALTEIARDNGPWQLVYCWTHLWMPPPLQGFSSSSVRHVPQLRSSIRPVLAMRPAPPALMVNLQAKSQSRAASSKLDASNGFIRLRSARSCHHVQKFPRNCGGSLSLNIEPHNSPLLTPSDAPAHRKCHRASASPRSCALSCLRWPRPRRSPGAGCAASQAKPRTSRASA